MSSPDDSERSDDSPNSDYAPKWARDIYRQGSPDTAKGGPPPSQRDLTFLRRSLDPETVDVPQPPPRRLGWFATGGGLIIAAALGVVIGLLATGELRSIFGNAPGSTTKTIELTSRSDNSKMPEQVSSPTDRWRNTAMALRWTAAGMLEAAKGFRRLKAYKHLPILRAALAAHQSKYVTQRVEHDADAA